MGYRHSREQLLDAAVALAQADGLSTLTFGRLAKSIGISDRMVVYYFPSKDDLVGEVLQAIAVQLMGVLAEAVGTEPLPADELCRRAWPLLQSTESDRLFALYFEALGLAAARIEPYRQAAATLFDFWISWVEPNVLAPTAARRRSDAAGVLARLDGLLLLRHSVGAAQAESAAKALGISGRKRPG